MYICPEVAVRIVDYGEGTSRRPEGAIANRRGRKRRCRSRAHDGKEDG